MTKIRSVLFSNKVNCRNIETLQYFDVGYGIFLRNEKGLLIFSRVRIMSEHIKNTSTRFTS